MLLASARGETAGQIGQHLSCTDQTVRNAIRADRFWVLTHPNFADALRHRANGIVEGFEPVVPPVL